MRDRVIFISSIFICDQLAVITTNVTVGLIKIFVEHPRNNY